MESRYLVEENSMAYQYSDYPSQARRLANAGASLLEAMEDPSMDPALAIVELEAAGSTIPPADLRARFEPVAGTGPASPPSAEDVFSRILLELQSANALMAAGMAMNEHGAGAEPRFLNDAVAQIRSTSSDLAAHMAKSTKLQFAPATKPSVTPEDALRLFGDSARRTLESIAGGTESVISSAFSKLKDVDQSKVSQAIDDLGKSFQVVATAGKLIRRGLEKLKAVLEALSNLFGTDAMAEIKAKVREIWQKVAADKTLVRNIIGTAAAQRQVGAFAAQPGLKISSLDDISRQLALLEDRFQGKRNILNGLETAVVVAMGIVGALQVFGLWAAAPWVVLAAAGAYAAIIGGALLVGMNYTGSRRLFGWTPGVCGIVPEQPPEGGQ
jgi:hypothetical protein